MTYRIVPLTASSQSISVTELTSRIRSTIEPPFRSVRVEGEVSNHLHHASGHRYFTLKDANAQIRCVLWRSSERNIVGELRDGRTVVVTGALTVYERDGRYQLQAQSVEVGGTGALLAEFERLKTRLAAEGLFDSSRKRPLPPFPIAVGIATSREGAALRDMVRILRDRWPSIGIVLRPCRVQGEGAASEIAEAVADLAADGGVDVIVVGRGGGSLEDLWAFNAEGVVRAIAASAIPVVSAVGHETDVTLSDFVADLRAPTPTAAAQAVVPDRREIFGKVSSLSGRLHRAADSTVSSGRSGLRAAFASLTDPGIVVDRLKGRHADAERRLVDAAREAVAVRREKVRRGDDAVRRRSPSEWLARRRGDLFVLSERLTRFTVDARAALAAKVSVLEGTLKALDPTAVLSRGYAIVTDVSSGRAVRSATDVAEGQELDVRVASGSFPARVGVTTRGVR